ncbi:hypothetical protein Ancab_016731 [Ancistrocladus abbreviatus]
MDKTRDVRRVFSRFSGQSNQVVYEKLKREKVRRLSVVAKDREGKEEETEMGSVGSDDEDELRPRNGINKKFKVPKKLFDNRNPVDHASVPRKLRSAMKKRSCKPTSSPLPNPKRLIHAVNGVELPKKDCLKKSKLSLQNGALDCSRRQAISGLITKDEEEVAEILYALAALVPGNSCLMRNKLEGESSVGKPLASPNKQKDSMPVPEVPKEESEVTCLPASGDVTNLAPATEASSEENEKVEFPAGPVFLSQDKLTNNGQFNLNVNSSVPQVNLRTICPSSNNESHEERSLQNSVCFSVPAELSIDSVHVKNHEAVLAQRKSDIVVDVTSQDQRQDAILDHRENGPTLSPGLISRGSHASEVDGHSLCLNLPSWLRTADYPSRPGSYEYGTSAKKVSRPVNNKGKSWKRCAAHAYIARLIQVLQISEEKDMQPSEACQLSSSEGVVTASNHQNAARNGLNGIVSTCGGIDFAGEKNLNEALNGVLLHRRLHHDHKLMCPAPEVHAPRKQSFDFLSLSTGSCGPHPKNDANLSRNVLDPLSHLQVPHVSSHLQHSAAPFPLPQNRRPAIYHKDQISAAAVGAPPPPQVHLQLPPYFGSYIRPLHISSTTSTPQPPQLQRQQEQQQPIWTAQLAAHYRYGTLRTSHIPIWQNERQDSRSSMQYIQTLLPPLQSSLETVRSKHLQIPQQQQQLIAVASSLPPSQTKTPHSQLSSSCEENGGRLCQEGIQPLQLLCNERF